MLIQKKEVNSKIYLLLSLCSPPSQGHYFLISIFPQSFRSAVADHESFDHEFFLNTNNPNNTNIFCTRISLISRICLCFAWLTDVHFCASLQI